MSQGSEVAATTDERRFSPALRPLLLLGGFVVLWWCLATGTAQAADGPHHGLGDATGALSAATHDATGQLHRAVGDEARAHQHTTTKVAQVVRHQVAPVRSALHRTPVARIVTTAASTLRAPVKPVIQKVRATLAAKPSGPATTHLKNVLDQHPSVGESSALQGKKPVSQLADPQVAAPVQHAVLDVADTADGGVGSSELAGQDQTSPGRPLQVPGRDLPSGSLGNATPSMADSGHDSGPSAASCESARVMAPRGAKTSISAPAGWPTAAPAYAPSSSPD